MSIPLTKEERVYLLQLARETLIRAVNQQTPREINLIRLQPILRENGASFVTLTIGGKLRGCIGSLEAHQPLAMDVKEHAVQAALEDYRFPPVSPKEIELVEIEISRLTKPVLLPYTEPSQLTELLRPGIDGVILQDGYRRSTFLPQVWEQIPLPDEFLSHLCVKMGAPANLWLKKRLEVSVYQVEEFHEGSEGLL